MATPITQITKRQLTPEEEKEKKLGELETLLVQQDQALNKILEITGELNDAGILDAVRAMVKARENLTGIAVHQASREPVTNLINNAMKAAAVVTTIDPNTTARVMNSVKSGLDEAELQRDNPKKVGVFRLIKALRDPDINRSIRFGLNFLKGMGRELGRK
ncbi:DUF1641 domain-containing protein [Planococcus sp. N028]|uniref:DUF1641 domain-containing protein n=1 Tax=Planococcus shixiaomingii TaxID=3058393 RepID=A0ABT8N2Y8_9BACL|nr:MULTISPECIES: DUF1641 domain-containing protein [unclassified Planococcus (in: firmicutes)]MDN7242262.1 DUF1641 domain-containing protein [Planococcus sp. N028]WKA54515.1 DUF1641 domain-containing protein [Planococcus sp. N022]